MIETRQQPHRVATDQARLPDGVAPAGTAGRILTAALTLFSRYGYYGTSIRDIAAASGISSATMYGHYPSKEHALAHLVQIGHEAWHARLQRALVQAGSTPAEQLMALVHAHVLTHAEFPLLAVVANQELHALSPEQAAPALSVRRQSQQLLIEILQRGVDAGQFHIGDVALVATAIGGMGLRVSNWFGPDSGYTAGQVADTYADLALRMAGADRSTP